MNTQTAECFVRNATKDSPQVQIDPVERVLLIQGRSLPEDAVSFFLPITAYLEQLLKNDSKTPFVADFRFEYFNTASIKQLAKLLLMLDMYLPKDLLIIRWHYADDFEMLDTGKRLSALISRNFEYSGQLPSASSAAGLESIPFTRFLLFSTAGLAVAATGATLVSNIAPAYYFGGMPWLMASFFTLSLVFGWFIAKASKGGKPIAQSFMAFSGGKFLIYLIVAATFAYLYKGQGKGVAAGLGICYLAFMASQILAIMPRQAR
jgi:hypothetical protein